MKQNGKAPAADLDVGGTRVYKTWLDAAGQQVLLEELRHVVAAAPLFSPMTPYGKPMSVRLTSAGRYGWFSDRKGYRYIETHPSGTPWPSIPGTALAVWQSISGVEREPDCCLINYYDQNARMGMHQDKDEADFSYPVVSISLGDEGLFRIGGTTRGGKTQSLWLGSGDVLVLGGTARLAYHGIDRIRFGSSALLRDGGRINLTLRVVDA